MKSTREESKSPQHHAPRQPEEEAQQETEPESPISQLQRQVGNLAVQRLLAQRSGDGGFGLDDETARRINQERSSGGPLDSGVQDQMGSSLGADFSGVRVHTSPESNRLNQDLGAKAFTTGNDIFFKEGAYQPGSSEGQELLAHELTHVVQQNSGATGDSGGAMQVNAPGDRFEQQADAAAQSVTVQRMSQAEDEEEPAQAPGPAGQAASVAAETGARQATEIANAGAAESSAAETAAQAGAAVAPSIGSQEAAAQQGADTAVSIINSQENSSGNKTGQMGSVNSAAASNAEQKAVEAAQTQAGPSAKPEEEELED